MSDDSEVFDDEEHAEEAEAGELDNISNENPFVQEMVPDCLSMLCKIGNGLAHAYVRMDCHERDLTDINHMKNFIHVRYVDISSNQITNLSPLNHLSHLLSLKANKNKLTSTEMEVRPYLQILELADNSLTELSGIDHPQLFRLNLNFNTINSLNGLNPNTLKNLDTLELRGNKLESMEDLHLPNLQTLYIASNLLKSLSGVSNLTNLKFLHIRDNQIETLEGCSEEMKKLEYINARGNDIKSIKEIEKLSCLPSLKIFLAVDNPCTGTDSYRIEVIAKLRKLKRLDKDEVTSEELQEVEEFLKNLISDKENEDEAEKTEEAED